MFSAKTVLFAIVAAAAAVNVSAAPIARRSSGRATYYAVGLGACGWTNSGNENVVALNTNMYGFTGAKSQYCGRQIEVHYNGNTQRATIVDACPSCPNSGDLDMSRALFSSLTNGNLDLGQFQMSWNFVGQGSSSGSSGSSSSSSSSNNSGNNRQAQQSQSSSTHSQSPRPTPTSSSSSASPSSTSSTANDNEANLVGGSISGKNVTTVPQWWAEVGNAGCPDAKVGQNQTAVAVGPSDLVDNDDLASACGKELVIVNNANKMNVSAIITTFMPDSERNTIILADGYKALANVTANEVPPAIANVTFGWAANSTKASN